LLIALVFGAAFGEGHDVIADGRACTSTMDETRDTPRLRLEQALASPLQCTSTDARDDGLIGGCAHRPACDFRAPHVAQSDCQFWRLSQKST
jgi:hypothetical protein